MFRNQVHLMTTKRVEGTADVGFPLILISEVQNAFRYLDQIEVSNASWPRLCFPPSFSSPLLGRFIPQAINRMQLPCSAGGVGILSAFQWTTHKASENPAFSRHIMKKVNLFTHHFILWPALLNQLGYWFLHQPLQGFAGIIAALMKLFEKRQITNLH